MGKARSGRPCRLHGDQTRSRPGVEDSTNPPSCRTPSWRSRHEWLANARLPFVVDSATTGSRCERRRSTALDGKSTSASIHIGSSKPSGGRRWPSGCGPGRWPHTATRRTAIASPLQFLNRRSHGGVYSGEGQEDHTAARVHRIARRNAGTSPASGCSGGRLRRVPQTAPAA